MLTRLETISLFTTPVLRRQLRVALQRSHFLEEQSLETTLTFSTCEPKLRTYHRTTLQGPAYISACKMAYRVEPNLATTVWQHANCFSPDLIQSGSSFTR
eukprot:PhF_6_TR12851/c0_g2_i1/m.20197